MSRRTKSKPKVAVFHRFLVHYRAGIFETMARSGEFDYEFWLGRQENKDDAFHKEIMETVPFHVRHSPVWEFTLPIVRARLYFYKGHISALLRRDIRVLIVGAGVYEISYLLATILGRLLGKKVIHWGHGVLRGGPRRPYRCWMLRQASRLANAVLLYGRREYDYYAQHGFPMDRVFVTNNALDTRPAKAIQQSITQEELTRFRKDKGIDGKRVLILTGRLLAEKEPILAVEAMPAILREIPDAMLLIIGDGPERRRLAARAGELGLGDRVHMPGMVYDEQELARYYLSSELAVVPGSVGLTVNHAFVYGVPLLTSDDYWRHSPEIAMVQEGRTGLLFRDGDAASLALRAIEILKDPPALQRMGQACRGLIDEKYNEVQMAESFDAAVRYALAH